jgi:hypothetical protein
MSERRRDGSRLSFSELDKLRREHKHGSDSGRGQGTAGSSGQKNYRAALEKAFDSGRLAEFAATMQRAREPFASAPMPAPAPRTPVDERLVAPAENPAPDSATAAASRRENPERAERRKLARQILDAETPRDTARTIDRYLEKFQELPRDLDILEKALGHLNTRVVLRALERLEDWLSKQKLRRSRSLAVQLSILEETHDDDDVRSLAARVRAAL